MIKLNKNVGNFDRAARVVLGLGVIAAGFYFESWFGLLGIIPLTTAFLRWCPVYLPFKFSTKGKSEV